MNATRVNLTKVEENLLFEHAFILFQGYYYVSSFRGSKRKPQGEDPIELQPISRWTSLVRLRDQHCHLLSWSDKENIWARGVSIFSQRMRQLYVTAKVVMERSARSYEGNDCAIIANILG
jgi:hypothetical protein